MKAYAVGHIASAFYNGLEFATLYGNRKIKVSRLGISERDVDLGQFMLRAFQDLKINFIT